MNKYLLFLSLFGSIAFADTLPMNQHEIPEEYKVEPVTETEDEELIRVALSDIEFHMILDSLKIASESIQKKDPYYANKLRQLAYELTPDYEE